MQVALQLMDNGPVIRGAAPFIEKWVNRIKDLRGFFQKDTDQIMVVDLASLPTTCYARPSLRIVSPSRRASIARS